MSLFDKAKHMLVTEDEEKKQISEAKPTVTSVPLDFSKLNVASPRVEEPVPASPFVVPGSVVPDEAIYQKVLDKTNFEKTEVGVVIHKYYEALDGLDANTRIKTAIKQAGKLDNVAPERILQTFDGLKTSLQEENDKFAKAVEAQTQKEVIGRQQVLQQISDQIDKLNKQITDLQAQHTQVSAELADAQNRIANAQTQMQLAVTRRASEIDTQKAQFSGLLR